MKMFDKNLNKPYVSLIFININESMGSLKIISVSNFLFILLKKRFEPALGY